MCLIKYCKIYWLEHGKTKIKPWIIPDNLPYKETLNEPTRNPYNKRKETYILYNLKSNSWSQQAEILATAVKSSSIYYEVPISYSGRTFEDGKKIKARHTLSVVWMIIKKRLF